VRESEKMVSDTATRLERVTGELEDLLVRAPHTLPFDSPADQGDVGGSLEFC